MSPVLENQDKAQRNVLLKTLGVLLFILGAGISFISFILVYISIGFGGDLLGTLFIVLFLILGVFLVVLGRKMMRR
jgi:polyferredoxin